MVLKFLSLFFSFPPKRIISEKMQPTEKQILTANPMVGIPDLIYCPDTLPSPWQEHPRRCPGPLSHLLRADHQPCHPLSPPLNSCFLLALRAMWGTFNLFFFFLKMSMYLPWFPFWDLTQCSSFFLPHYYTWHHKTKNLAIAGLTSPWIGQVDWSSRDHRPISFSHGASSMADTAAGSSAEGGRHEVCLALGALSTWEPPR